MLQTIRSKAHGWIAWVVIISVAAVFAVWGVSGYLGGATTAVAEVNGVAISQDEFTRTFERMAAQQERAMQEMGRTDIAMNQAAVRAEALNSLVQEKLLIEAANKQGFKIARKTIDDLLLTLPQFQENGKFSPERFELLAKNLGYTTTTLRQALHDDLLIGQMQVSLMQSEFALPAETTQLIALVEQKRDFDYVVFSAAAHESNVAVSDEAIQKYFEANSGNFMLPEKVQLEYLVLSAKDTALPQPEEESVKAFYNENQAQYTQPEQRHAAHILILVAPDADQAATEKAKTQADEIMASLKKGETFADLAKKFSADSFSADKGGDLGWFSRGQMVPAFEDAVFSAQPNTVVGPIKTQFGYHIIDVLAVRPAIVEPFDKVREEVLAELLRAEREALFEDRVAELDDLAYNNPNSLTVAAQILNVPLKTTGLLTRDDVAALGELNNPGVINAAFSDEVIEQDQNSTVLYLDPQTVVVVRKKAYEPAKIKALAEVKAEIHKKLSLAQALDVAEKAALEYAQHYAKGQTALPNKTMTWKKATKANRREADISPAVLRKAFDLPNPVSGKSSVGTASLGEEGVAVVVVNNIYPGELTENEAEVRVEAAHGLATYYGERDYQLYVVGLQKAANIQVLID